jgi:hypothetical protein
MKSKVIPMTSSACHLIYLPINAEEFRVLISSLWSTELAIRSMALLDDNPVGASQREAEVRKIEALSEKVIAIAGLSQNN